SVAAIRTASEIWSDILSGWAPVTDSEVNRVRLITYISPSGYADRSYVISLCLPTAGHTSGRIPNRMNPTTRNGRLSRDSAQFAHLQAGSPPIEGDRQTGPPIIGYVVLSALQRHASLRFLRLQTCSFLQ